MKLILRRRRGMVVQMAALLVVLGILAVSPEVEAQQAARTPRIGLLILTSASSGAGAAGIQALRSSLADLGYIEGRTITIEYRSAEGRAERLAELATELVARKVDLIVSGGGNVSALAARKATTTIPIVMSSSVDAVDVGLIDSLARPGGNVTGLTVPRELGAKQLELLRELVPSPSRVVIVNRSNAARRAQRAQAKAMALAYLQMTLAYVEVQEPEDLARAFVTAQATRPHAMIVAPDPLFFQERQRILDFARAARLPVMYPFRDFVDAGGLVSYSVSSVEVSRAAARYVDKILKGARPADLPVEQPTKFELVINLKTARALGLTIPPSLLLRADEVIE
jgi:putative ABC transport system substrate-binding protein